MLIGVLALQGDFAEHVATLDRIGIEHRLVRLPEQLQDLAGLIIPGGESTTMGKLATHFNLMEPLREFGRTHPVWGTCAGAVFLSKDIHRSQPLLELMDITVQRNAFGRQVASFEIDLDVPALGQVAPENPPHHAIFIRAPLIEAVGPQVDILASLPDGRIVAARQNNLLATSFHPELTTDDRFHRYFAAMIPVKV